MNVHTWLTRTISIEDAAGQQQMETATVVGSITAAGNAAVVITAVGMTGSPITLAVAVAGVAQVETATVVGTIGAGGAGNATVVVTSAGMAGSPITVSVAVANNDSASTVAGKIRTDLALNATIAARFTISGATDKVILTRKAPFAANDSTLNISTDNGTCSGLTAAPTSANTTAGIASDDASAVATKIRTDLVANANVDAFFIVAGTGADVILIAKTPAANGATMNLSVDNGTCTGLTAALTSANTQAGIAPGTAPT
jgi:hypothetical protein